MKTKRNKYNISQWISQ